MLLSLSLPAAPRAAARGGQIVPVDSNAAVPVIGTPVPLPPPPSATPAPPRVPFARAWRVPLPSATLETRLVVTPSRAIVASPAGPMQAYDLADGQVAWTEDWQARAATYADGLLYAVNDLQVYAVVPDSGELQWLVGAGEPGHSLAVAPNLLLVLSHRDVRAFTRTDGTPAWRAELPAPPSTALAVLDSLIVAGLQDRSVVGLDLATGALRWRATFDDVPAAVMLAGERVYVTLPRVAVCAARATDGHLDWCTTELRVPARGAPVVHGGRLEVALLDTTLRAFNPETGTMLRSETLGARPLTGPIAIGPDLVVPLSPNGLAVVSSSGTIARVTAPAGEPAESSEQVAANPDARAIVTLNIAIGNARSLSAYRPPDLPAPPSRGEP